MTQSTPGDPEEQAGKSVFSVVRTQVIKVTDLLLAVARRLSV